MSSKVVRSLGLVALGAIAAIVGERLVGRGPADPRTQLLAQLAERQDEHLEQLDSLMAERTRTNQDLVLGQYFRLQRFRRFAQRGLDLSLVVLVPRGTTGEEVLAGAPIDRTIRVPRIALDSLARGEWTSAAEALAAAGGSVDQRIFEAFGEILRFAADHPWPDGGGLSVLTRSEWSSPLVVDRWLALNRKLVADVDGVLSLSF